MARYLTNRYVATTWAEAVRLAQLDGTPLSQIRSTAQATLVHRTDWWAWWSDQQLTTAIGLPENLQPQGLSPDAAELVDGVWGSDTPSPHCGWLTLAQVRQILSIELLSMVTAESPNRFVYAATWERLIVEFQDGQQGTLYRFWYGYEDGYWYQISTEGSR